MREIKFRGRGINGNWYVGNLSILRIDNGNIKKGYYISNKVGMPFAYEIQPKTLGQFTGLLDRNGKEIWEGDIIKPVNPPSEKKTDRAVEFVDGSFCYNESLIRGIRGCWALNSRKTKLFEVIGNIFENKNLIEPQPLKEYN